MKYICYARVSTQHQNDTSIEAQLLFLERLAKEMNYPFEKYYEKASGKNIDGRAVFKTVISILEPGDILGVYDNSRLGRDTQENLSIVKELYRRGVRVQIGGKIIDLSNPQDELLLSIESSISTFQRKIQLQKSRVGMDLKRDNGDWVFQGNMFGWKTYKTAGKTIAEIDAEEAKLIEYLFKEYAKGRSARDVGRDLEQMTNGKYSKSRFANGNISRTLRNPLYMGYYVRDTGYNTKIAFMTEDKIRPLLVKSNIYPPIITEELWWNVHNNWNHTVKSNDIQFDYHYSKFELSSVLRCPYCKSPYCHGYSKSKAGKTVTVTYSCTAHGKGNRDCNVPKRTLREHILLDIMRSAFLLTFSYSDEIVAFYASKRNELLNLTSDENTQIEGVNKMISDIDSRIGRLVTAVEEGIMDIATVRTRMSALKQEKNDLEIRRMSIETAIARKRADFEDMLQMENEDTLSMFDDIDLRRELYLKYSEYAYVYPDFIDVKFINGKRFKFAMWEKYKRSNIAPVKFEMFYNGELQEIGEVDTTTHTVRFTGEAKDVWQVYARGDEIASDVSKVLLRLSVQTDNWHNTRNDGSYKIR